MIITKTPFRISFFGGGTDYPEHFEKYGGAVLGSTIDKASYLTAYPFLSRLFDYNIRIAYRQVECVNSIEEIQHTPFKECLRWCGIDKNIEINNTAELPAFSGLGTSSTFIVGLLNTLYAFKGIKKTNMELAYEAIEIERNVLKESVGCQDQVFAAVGGLNLIEFKKVNDISVHKIEITKDRLSELENSLVLVFTGLKRRASDIAKNQIAKVDDNKSQLLELRKMVDEGYSIITGAGSLENFGKLLDRGWHIKKTLDQKVTNSAIEQLYKYGIESGALGGKLLGAGGGGFILFYVPACKREHFNQSMKEFEMINVKLDAEGSSVLYK